MTETLEALEKDRKLFYLFKAAIQAEQEAQETYKRALEYTDNPALKEVLKRLHEDELGHEEKLNDYYTELRRKLGTDGSPSDREARRQSDSR